MSAASAVLLLFATVVLTRRPNSIVGETTNLASVVSDWVRPHKWAVGISAGDGDGDGGVDGSGGVEGGGAGAVRIGGDSDLVHDDDLGVVFSDRYTQKHGQYFNNYTFMHSFDSLVAAYQNTTIQVNFFASVFLSSNTQKYP